MSLGQISPEVADRQDYIHVHNAANSQEMAHHWERVTVADRVKGRQASDDGARGWG